MPAAAAAEASSTGSGKMVPFLLADIGEGIAEVEMMQWFVREGDTVKQFDRVCEVQSDKATVEISSRYDGVVRKVHHQVGAVVKVGSALVDIEVAGAGDGLDLAGGGGVAPALPTMNNADLPPLATDALTSSPPLVNQVSPQQAHAAAAEVQFDGIIPTTPAVRRLAKEYGVDLALVRPTGPQSRVLKGDVLDFIRTRNGGDGGGLAMTMPSPAVLNGAAASASPQQPPILLPTTAAAPVPVAQQPMPVLPPPGPLSAAVLTEPVRVPVRGVMRQMIKSMNASLKIPHFGYQDEVTMDKATALRDSLKPLAVAQGLPKFTYLPLMLKAASLALLQYPILNASLSPDETEVVYHPDHHIGVAMATPKGLVVPVLRAVQTKSILQIARELHDFTQRAQGLNGGFAEEHFAGATFTLSNIGSLGTCTFHLPTYSIICSPIHLPTHPYMTGGTYMDAKIVPPQVAIGAVGRIQTLPRFGGVDGQTVLPTRVLAISWAGDHRVIDGATMARFSNLWKMYLEEPAAMLAETR